MALIASPDGEIGKRTGLKSPRIFLVGSSPTPGTNKGTIMAAKKQYVVACLKHGKENKDWAGKQVKVNPPKGSRASRMTGCPQCKAEQLAART